MGLLLHDEVHHVTSDHDLVLCPLTAFLVVLIALTIVGFKVEGVGVLYVVMLTYPLMR